MIEALNKCGKDYNDFLLKTEKRADGPQGYTSFLPVFPCILLCFLLQPKLIICNFAI